MKTLLSTFGFFVAICQSSLAGGDSFPVEIVALKAKHNGEYLMEFIQHGAPYGYALKNGPQRVIVNLRFDESSFGKETALTSRRKYEEAIALLKQHAKKKEKTMFGVIAQGYLPIKGKKDEYQSNALAILKQSDGKLVVFSFAHKP
jgi:hypothetical protein